MRQDVIACRGRVHDAPLVPVNALLRLGRAWLQAAATEHDLDADEGNKIRENKAEERLLARMMISRMQTAIIPDVMQKNKHVCVAEKILGIRFTHLEEGFTVSGEVKL